MPIMTMPRDFVVSSTRGHTVAFKKDAPIHVPEDAALIEQCCRYGAQYAAGAQPVVIPLKDGKKGPTLPATIEDRTRVIGELLAEMRDNAAEHRENFTASGRPNAKFVSRSVGFEVPADEVERVWFAVTKQ